MEFDVFDYIKKEWKFILSIIILINIISIFGLFKTEKINYQSKISIRLPQYVYTNPDIQTIIHVGEDYVANEVGNKDYGVELRGFSNPGTTIIDFTVTGRNPDKVLTFTQEVRPKLIEEINKLLEERFAYEWQLKNAQSGNITDYHSVQDLIHLAGATDLTESQNISPKVQQGRTKIMLTTFMGSIILSGCISILHYLFTIKTKI